MTLKVVKSLIWKGLYTSYKDRYIWLYRIHITDWYVFETQRLWDTGIHPGKDRFSNAARIRLFFQLQQIEPYLRIFSEFNLRSIKAGIHPSPPPHHRGGGSAGPMSWGGGRNILKKGRGKVEKCNKKRKKEELL
jgi:hypothetical protein